MIDFNKVLGDPIFWITALYYLFSSGIQAMPEPDKDSNQFYVFVYKWLHAIGANWTQFKNANFVQTVKKVDNENKS